MRNTIKEQLSQAQSLWVARRDFLKSAGAGMGAAAAVGTLLSPGEASAQPGVYHPEFQVASRRLREQRVKRIASCSYAVRQIFKIWPKQPPSTGLTPERRAAYEAELAESNRWKEKYGVISSMTDFPQFTKDTYPGVTHMDVWDAIFGDPTDSSQFASDGSFDPSTASSKRYLDKFADNIAKTGVSVQHIANNGPKHLCDADEADRREGIRVAKMWMDAAKQIGARSMRANTGGPRVLPQGTEVPGAEGGHVQNYAVQPYIERCIQSYKELAEYGEKLGVKITIENHWGIAADPVYVRIVIGEVNSPWCETTPDFCNWELEWMCYYGLELLAPLGNSMVHAKRKTVYPNVDVARCVNIMDNAHYRGYFGLEYESGGDPVAGTIKLMNDVVDALV